MMNDLEPLSTEDRDLPTPDTLRALLRYDPDTGQLFWRERSVKWFTPTKRRTAEHKMNNWNSKCAGREAFTAEAADHVGKKRRSGRIFDKTYLAHRVIWALVTGKWPKEDVDHIDQNPLNNCWNNLRAVPHKHNMRNVSRRKDNTSGVCGVYLDRRSGKWFAQLCVDGLVLNLGTFTDLSDAAAARKKAEIDYGFHQNHGKEKNDLS